MTGIPLALDMCGLSPGRPSFSPAKLAHFATWTLTCALAIALPLAAFDSFLFGRAVLAPLNILLYNVFPAHRQGPDLYGTEPLTFYILNCILNFNILFPLACLALLATFIASHLLARGQSVGVMVFSTQKSKFYTKNITK